MRPPSFFFLTDVIRFLVPVICDLFPVARSSCLNSFEKAMQHLSNVDNPSQERPEVIIGYQLEIPR